MRLDAANPRSYTTGRTVWNDLSGNGNNGTLTNGPTFNSSNGGSIQFDGTNQYVDNVGGLSSFSFIQNTGIYTISTWINLKIFTTEYVFAGNNDSTRLKKGFYISGLSNGTLNLVMTYGNTNFFTLNHVIPSFFTLNTWINITCTGDGINSKIYKNGLYNSVNLFGNLSTSDSSNTLALGRVNNYNGYYFNGNIANFQIYNRALSASEVLQNYNATRARFGV